MGLFQKKRQRVEEQPTRILITGQFDASLFDSFVEEDTARTPITIVHGYTGADSYDSFAQTMQRTLRHTYDVSVYTIGTTWKAIDEQTIEQLERHDTYPTVIVPRQATAVIRQLEDRHVPYVERDSLHVDAFVERLHAQHTARRQLEATKQSVEADIRKHVAAAFAVGFTPIPFADGPILLANQAKMLSSVMQQYELGNVSKQIQTVIGALGAGQVVSQIGRYAVAQAAKLVPGVGTIAGGVINGTIASAITVALGLTVSELSNRVALQQIVNENASTKQLLEATFTKKEAKRLFDQFLKREQSS